MVNIWTKFGAFARNCTERPTFSPKAPDYDKVGLATNARSELPHYGTALARRPYGPLVTWEVGVTLRVFVCVCDYLI